MKAARSLALAVAVGTAAANAALAGDGPPHPTYVRTIHARKLGPYYRVMSHFSRGTPLAGPITVRTESGGYIRTNGRLP